MEQSDTNTFKVGERVHRYLYSTTAVRANTRNLICKLSQSLPETFVFGGMIRDFSLGLAREFNSDIDLVSMDDRTTIFSAIRQYNPEINKFGGFRFAVGRQLFDIWSFQDTWAFREGLVKATTIDDLCATTFFDIDAVCLPLKSRKIISSAKYLDSVRNSTLDINLEENPAPGKIAVRAARMAINSGIRISPRLQLFIIKNTKDTFWRGEIAALFLKLMVKHNEKHADLPFSFCPQIDLFKFSSIY